MASSSSHSRFQTQPATRLAALPLIAFFDVETSGSKETKDPSSCELLEFGVIIICPASLVEVTSYTTLIRPIDPASARYTGGLTWNSLSRAHLFHEVASTIYMLLHGRVWGGHYIKRFDVLRIREAYHKIGMTPPEPIGIIDTWDLCKDLDFDRRTGNGKLETLGAYFGKDKQTHRCLDCVRRSIDVFKDISTVVTLEKILEQQGINVNNVVEHAISSGCNDGFLEPSCVSIADIKISDALYHFGRSITIKHKDCPLKLCCTDLKIRFGISDGKKFEDNSGRPKKRIAVVINKKINLMEVLAFCDDRARKLFEESDMHDKSQWMPLIKEEENINGHDGHVKTSFVRLNIPIVEYTNDATYSTSTWIRKREPSGNIQELSFSDVAPELLVRGRKVEAFFSVEAYDFHQRAGIRLVAKGLVV